MLVRYIHLNPVRAKVTRRAEDYVYSSHLEYIGTATRGLVDVEPILRLFGAKKKTALQRFVEYVAAGVKLGHCDDLYSVGEGCILGSEEFVDATIHRIGESERKPKARKSVGPARRFDPEALFTAIESVCGIKHEDFCGPGKGRNVLSAKEALILSGHKLGANLSVLSQVTGLSSATVSKRFDVGKRKLNHDSEFRSLVERIDERYQIEESKA
jgi:hypothetical protein